MKEYLRQQVDWQQPFPPAEYARRRTQVRGALIGAQLDALYVTTPADLTWLTGYDMIYYNLGTLTGCLVRADRDEMVFFDSVKHVSIVSTSPEVPEVVYLDQAVPSASASPRIDVIINEIHARGLGASRIGLQMWGYSPHASEMKTFNGMLTARGAKTVDAWQLIEEIRMVKSPLEVLHIRKAAEIADAAMIAARDAIAPGVLETSLEAELMSTMMSAGGGYPAIRSMIGSGPRSGTHHSPPVRRPIEQGDLVFVDFCASYDRYHVNVNRTFSLGQPDPRWVELMDKSAGCIDAVISQAKLGEPLSSVDALAQRYTDEAGLREYVWWVGGYSLGIAVPPDWCGNHWLSPRFGMSDRALEPGMVFNLENQFDVWEDWPGGSGCAYIESLLVTENGVEVLSKLPRTLVSV